MLNRGNYRNAVTFKLTEGTCRKKKLERVGKRVYKASPKEQQHTGVSKNKRERIAGGASLPSLIRKREPRRGRKAPENVEPDRVMYGRK